MSVTSFIEAHRWFYGVVALNILQIIPDIAVQASGPSYSVHQLCNALLAEGMETTLATLDWAPMTNPPIFRECFPIGMGPRKLGRSPQMLRWLLKEGKRFEIIHNHSLWMMPNIYAGRVSRAFSTPLVVSPRGTMSKWALSSGSPFKRIFWHLLQKSTLAHASCLHATSLSEMNDIRRLGFRQPIAVIPNGVDIRPLQSKKHDGDRVLLFLGRIDPVKGLNVLLPAWKKIEANFNNWKLMIVGPDSNGYLPKVKALAKSLDLKKAHFLDAVYGVDKHNLLSCADLFVLPSYSENFAVAVAEALAAGTPVVTTKGTPWQGLVERNAGWWIDQDVPSLTECLTIAMNLPTAKLQEMGQNGRDWMESSYSWKFVATSMISVYKWLVGKTDRPCSVHVD